MGFYSNVIFPRLYDCLMDQSFWAKYRRKQLQHVDGEILEVGVGTGLNLPHYPEHVNRITTVEPSPGMNKKLKRRISESSIQVDNRMIQSESLPFADESFDCIVSTLTLCSIPNIHQAISELYRVLKRNGRFHFLEHGISPDPKVAKWQKRLDSFQKRVACGCTLILDVPTLFDSLPFQSVKIENFVMEKTPKTHGYMYQGIATK